MKNSNITLNGSEAGRLCGSMTAASLFTALVIDGSEYKQTSWLCAVLGFLLSLPVLLAVERIVHTDRRLSRPIFAMISIYMAYKAAAISRLLINSVSYSNLEIIPPWMITLIIAAACFYIITRNGAGIGNSLKLCAIPVMILTAIMFIGSFKYMNVRWMSPVCGDGATAIIKGTIKAAGNISAAGLICLAAENDGKISHRAINGSAAGVVAGTLLCLYSVLMTPVQLQAVSNRLASIERFLSNGRTSLGVQLPITILWFLGYIMALGSYSFASAVFVQRAFPDMRRRNAAFLCMAAVFVIAGIGLAESDILRMVNNYAYAGAGLLTAALCIMGRNRNEAAL